MKAQILKIAGVKNEKEFYRKFPTEEAFMEKHGEALQKAQLGAVIPGLNDSDIVGISNIIKKNNRKNNINTGLGMLANQSGSIVGLSQSIADKYGRQSKQSNQLDEMIGLAKKASASATQPFKQKYVSPEDQIIQPINPLGVQGFGYFENGGEIQNTFAPNDIYTDMGYEPLNDSNPKQYQYGGGITNATKSKGGFDPSSFMSAAGSLGGGLGSLMGGSDFEQTEEGSLLSTIGGVAGTAIAGPVGGLVGAGIAGTVGGYIGGNKKHETKVKTQNQQNAIGSLSGIANIQNMNQGSAYVRNGGNINSYENGGWMNPEYNPQIIAKFGDYSMDQLLAPPHDADMLRAGGHLAQVNYTSPSAEAMYTGRNQMQYGGQMAMGGELQTLWGGGLETISRNPYDDSEIVMPKGQSHDESDGKGRTGIGLKYGDGGMSDYAEYGASDQDASVEVEKNEPMVKMADGGNKDNLVVFGNMIESKSKKKYKVLAKEIAEDNAKQNKKIQKAEISANNNDDDTVFGQFKKNTDFASILGPQMKLKQNSMELKDYAAKQNAILDTAKEFGLESDALAKGEIKYAKPDDPYAEFGAKLTAAAGANLSGIHPSVAGLIDLLKKKGYASQITSGKRSGKTSSGRDSRHNIGEAVDMVFPKLGTKAYKTLTKDPDVVKYMMDNGLTAINEYDPRIRRQTGGTGPHIHFGFDKGTGLADKFRNAVSSTWEGLKGLTGEASDFISDNFATPNVKKNSSDLYVKPKARRADLNAPKKVPVYKQPGYVNTPPQGAAPVTQAPVFDAIDLEVNRRNQALLAPKRVTNAPVFPSPIDNNGNYYMSDSEYEPMQSPIQYQPSIASASQFPSPMDEQDNYYMPIAQETASSPSPSPMLKTLQSPNDPRLLGWDGTNNYQNQGPVNSDTQALKQSPKSSSNWWETGTQFANSLIPYMRPSNQMQLSPQQLSGELLALSDNTLEPVYAQSYQPMYTQPVSISYQDQLNANQADFNAMQRQFGYSPEVAAALAGQKYGANTKILGEQSRANQAEQQRARETNRETANDAQLKNMNIYQDQANKMSQTKSIMKQQKIAALNSINDKYLKNQLENKQLAIGENMYNYRYSPNGVAYNANPLANFAPYGSGYGNKGTKGQLAPGKAYSYDDNDKIIGVHSVGKEDGAKNGKKVSRNGSIVKAIKGL